MTPQHRFVCPQCGGENVIADARVMWDKENQCWKISSVPYDEDFCEDCDGEVRGQFEEMQ